MHNGILTINLTAIQHNWLAIERQLNTTTECGAVIKANAYGLGSERVAPSLYRAGCRSFFVATVDEGVEARAYLPDDTTVYVLTDPGLGLENDCIRHRLVPVFYTIEQLRRWRTACSQASIAAPCAIKIDTGMTRLGLHMAEFEELCSEPLLLRDCNPLLFMSHLACADEPDNPLNGLQLTRYKQAVEKVRLLCPTMRFSLANSSGILLGREWHFDLVRPGAALYGVNPQPSKDNTTVESVVDLQLPVVQIREVPHAGATVGYAASYTTTRPARLAVALGGYADGIHRIVGAKGYGVLAGVRVPVVGRISMDSTIFDITDVPFAQLPPADKCQIQVLGPSISVDEAAAVAGGLGYETLTSLGDRFRRRYIGGVNGY